MDQQKGVMDFETKGERRVLRNKSAKIALKRLCRKCLKDKFSKKHKERCQRCKDTIYQKCICRLCEQKTLAVINCGLRNDCLI